MPIAWRSWSDATAAELAMLARPILCLVEDPENGLIAPFLRELDKAMERDEALQAQLAFYPALRVKVGGLPLLLSEYGAGRSFHLALLSPHGFNPMVVFELHKMVGAGGMDVSGITQALVVARDVYGPQFPEPAAASPTSTRDTVIGFGVLAAALGLAIWRCG